MGSTGIHVGNPNYEPITGRLGDFENDFRQGNSNVNIEHAALFDSNGEPIIGYVGERHSVAVDNRALNTPGATLSHFHPDKGFGGTLSMADLKLFSKSQLGELRAVSKQGQLYSIKAGQNADRQGLAKWLKRVEPIAKKNFNNSYEKAFKTVTTPLKSGPHKGEVKITDPKTGKSVYRQPMTPVQARNFARQYSVGMFDRMYSKNLSKFGVTYTATKGGYATKAKK